MKKKIILSLYSGKKIKKNAPSWFREGVAEQMKLGKKIEEAIKKMASSPFFQPDWLE